MVDAPAVVEVSRHAYHVSDRGWTFQPVAVFSGRAIMRARARRDMARRVQFCGIPVHETTTPVLVRYLERRAFAHRAPLAVGFANHNFVVSCRSLVRSSVTEPGAGDILVVNDGIGVQVASLLRYGRGFRENMNGTDFVPHFLRAAKRELSVYLLGGTPEAVAGAAATIGALPHRRIVGCCDGFSLWAREDAVVREINAARPDVLLVGLGNPKQERWILAHRRELRVGVVFAVGALFDWIGGSRQRAPRLVRRLRLEWLYRLSLEPKRLLKRYTVDAAVFFWLVLVRRS